jgi:hypothetical protein
MMKQRPRIYYTEEQKALMWVAGSKATFGHEQVCNSSHIMLTTSGLWATSPRVPA